MSSQTPQQSALELAKAEMNEVYRKLQRDIDSLRTASINEHGDCIDSIQEYIKQSQKNSTLNLEKAREAFDLRMRDQQSLWRGDLKQMETAHEQIEQKIRHTGSLMKERDDAKAKYDQMKSENDKAQLKLKSLSTGLSQAAVGLEEARRCVTDAQREIEVLKQHNIDLQQGSASVTQSRKDISNEHAVMRNHEPELQADVEAVNQRASSTEAEPNTLQSGLDRTNKSMADLASSIAERSTTSQLTSTSAASTTRQGSSKETADGIEIASDQQHPQGLVSQPAHSQHMGEADRLFCQNVLHKVRHDLMVQDDIPFFLASSGISQPMNLTVIDDKLQKGAYMSVNSLREDFDLMIKLYKGIMPPRGTLQTASENLRRTFEDAWSALQESDSTHQRSTTQNHTDNDSESRGLKRKASTERPVTSEDTAKPRRAPSPSQLSKDSTQPTSLATGDESNPALPQSERVQAMSGQLAGTGSDVWKGKVTTTSNFGLSPPVQVHVTATLASIAKSPKTFQGPWTNLIPTELCVQYRRTKPVVDDHFTDLDFELDNDMIILCLVPSSESDKKEFRRLRRDLIDRKRYAKVNHGSVGRGNGGRVASLHLIPASTSGRYPECIARFNHELIPPPGDQKALFLVVGFHVRHQEYEQVLKAWGQVFNALRTAEHTKAIVDARDRVAHHPLQLERDGWQRISVAKNYMTLLDGVPFAKSDTNLAPGVGEFLNLSYSQPGKVGDIKLPSRVFVLGGLMHDTVLKGLVVVDLQHSDRPVWEICLRIGRRTLGDAMRLLRSKVPSSTENWLSSSGLWLGRRAGSSMQAEVLGLKIERCGHSG